MGVIRNRHDLSLTCLAVLIAKPLLPADERVLEVAGTTARLVREFLTLDQALCLFSMWFIANRSGGLSLGWWWDWLGARTESRYEIFPRALCNRFPLAGKSRCRIAGGRRLMIRP